jgi:pimeloyl-ACP methyl ester carboxylesterase
MKAGFHERNFDTGQVKLNYVVGPNTGPAFVLIPAQMGTWESYQAVMAPLSKKYQVYGVDIRGHGKSSWTPGDYSWKSIGRDMMAFLQQVVKRPAIVAGNSSGGIISLWCAANVPEFVSGIVLEDAPVFSAEMPRFKEQDRFVYNGLNHFVDTIGNLDHRDLADYFRGMEVPRSEKSSRKLPDWYVNLLSRQIKKFIAEHPGQPIEVGFPDTMKLLLKSLSMFDPDFSRAFVDGRFYEGIDHAEALKRVKCPMLVLHADWHRYAKFGFVGAMDDQAVKRILELAPHTQYRRISANHVIHAFKPKEYILAVEEFASKLQ